MGLQQEIDTQRSEIRTDGYSMSIGELISLYEHDEIDIHPEFQRFFRWDIWQKSRLIESILLGLPIPSIFVSQREDGIWDIVDGLQRLSTIFEFVGILKDENKTLVLPLKLAKTKYLPSLEEVFWDDDCFQRQQTLPRRASLIEDGDSHLKTLTPAQRLLIRRAKMNVNILLRESDENSKYELFQRLNTGGSSLSNQEARNCILISANAEMFRWLRELSHLENFTNCINLTDRATLEQYDMELVLRFLIFRNLELNKIKNIGDLNVFLTEQMLSIATAKDFDKEKEERCFKETFTLLSETVGGNSFRKYDVGKDRFMGGFLVSAFEMTALGIGYNIDRINQQNRDIEAKIKKMWQMQEFTKISGSGISSSSRIPKIIPLARRVFES